MKEAIRNDIASELRSLRAKEDITIECLVKKTGVSKDTICRYENASVSMNIDNLEKILNSYNIDFNIFFSNIYANKHKTINQKQE